MNWNSLSHTHADNKADTKSIESITIWINNVWIVCRCPCMSGVSECVVLSARIFRRKREREKHDVRIQHLVGVINSLRCFFFSKFYCHQNCSIRNSYMETIRLKFKRYQKQHKHPASQPASQRKRSIGEYHLQKMTRKKIERFLRRKKWFTSLLTIYSLFSFFLHLSRFDVNDIGESRAYHVFTWHNWIRTLFPSFDETIERQRTSTCVRVCVFENAMK